MLDQPVDVVAELVGEDHAPDRRLHHLWRCAEWTSCERPVGHADAVGVLLEGQVQRPGVEDSDLDHVSLPPSIRRRPCSWRVPPSTLGARRPKGGGAADPLNGGTSRGRPAGGRARLPDSPRRWSPTRARRAWTCRVRWCPTSSGTRRGGFPDKVAVDVDGDTLTFAEVSDRASRWPRSCCARGIGEGERVATADAQRASRSLEIRVGAQRAGAILVPLNYRLAEAELAAMLEDCEPDLLVVGPEFADSAARMPVPALLRIGAPASDGPESYARAPPRRPAARTVGLPPERICHISYTSGTTGAPQGRDAVQPRRSTPARSRWATSSAPTRTPTFLAVTPLFHVGSQVGSRARTSAARSCRAQRSTRTASWPRSSARRRRTASSCRR